MVIKRGVFYTIFAVVVAFGIMYRPVDGAPQPIKQVQTDVMDSLHVPGCDRGYDKDHFPCD